MFGIIQKSLDSFLEDKFCSKEVLDYFMLK